MISLLAEPEIKLRTNGSELVLWACQAFDDEYSFRTLLAGLSAVLEAERPVSLSLPPEEPQEDFVDGTMQWGATRYSIYFERSLGYLQFSGDESAIRDLLEGVKNALEWAEK